MATLDVVPVETALPKDTAYIDTYDRDWQVHFCLSQVSPLESSRLVLSCLTDSRPLNFSQPKSHCRKAEMHSRSAGVRLLVKHRQKGHISQ